jgi:hypothetical protein
MTEEKINALRQADTNLRGALKMDEAELPQMPVDLNERLMQRMAVEEKKPRRTIIWPWIAAACVAGVMIIWLTPPKEDASPLTPLQEARGTQAKEVVMPKVEKEIEQKIAKVETEATAPMPTPTKTKITRGKTTVAKRDVALLAQETKAEEPVAKPVVDEVHKDLAVAETAKSQKKMVTMTERDIPITRPENYKYTPEELALMKKQANEAYLKWAQLELEIAKHNLEQTAQK